MLINEDCRVLKAAVSSAICTRVFSAVSFNMFAVPWAAESTALNGNRSIADMNCPLNKCTSGSGSSFTHGDAPYWALQNLVYIHDLSPAYISSDYQHSIRVREVVALARRSFYRWQEEVAMWKQDSVMKPTSEGTLYCIKIVTWKKNGPQILLEDRSLREEVLQRATIRHGLPALLSFRRK